MFNEISVVIVNGDMTNGDVWEVFTIKKENDEELEETRNRLANAIQLFLSETSLDKKITIEIVFKN